MQRTVMSQTPRTWQGFMARAYAYRGKGQLELAIADLDEAVRLTPEPSASVYERRGWFQLELRNYELALADLEETIRLSPAPLASTYHRRALAHSGLGHHDEALADFDEAIRLSPKPDALTYIYADRGDLYTTLGRHEEALADYDRIIELHPSAAHLYNLRGDLYSTLERHEEALADYDRSIELNPTAWHLYKRRGVAHFHLGNFDEALADIAKAVELRPDDVSNLSWIPLQLVAKCPNERFRLGMFELADKTVQLNQGASEAYCIRAELHAALGHREEALADFDRSIELNPTGSHLYKCRGSAHFELGHYDKALADIAKAVELKPDDTSNVRWIPLQLVAKCPNEPFRLGMFELADKTVELNPGVLETYCVRGHLHAALGHREEALADFEKARQFDPDYSPAPGPPEHAEAYVIHYGLLQPNEERWNQALVHLRQHLRSGDQIAPAWLDWVSRWLPAMLPNTDSLPGIVFVSDMPWVRSTCGWNALLGWGPEEALRDRVPQPELGSISIAGLPYSKGAWNQSFEDERPADVVLDISGQQFVRFKAHVGLGNKGSAQFQVFVDGDLKHETPIVRLGTLQAICVDVAGAKEVVLRVLNGGDGAGYDCVLWGYARFVETGAEDPLEIPPAELHSATDANAAFFLAEVHWRLDQKDLARRWFDKAAEWTDKNQPDDEDLRRCRAEAAELLGVSKTPSADKEKPVS
ncbi:MAG: tetratricopeptide repeat protein [Planctomycetota bacterium]